MLFYTKRLLITVLFFNYQAVQFINGNPVDSHDPSAKVANTESNGYSSWVPEWCRRGYNNLFGNDGIITRIVPSFFSSSKPEPIRCCCRLVPDDDQSTPGTDVRDINEQEDKKGKGSRCLRAGGKVLKNTGMCLGAVGFGCGWFFVEACKEIGGLAAVVFIYMPVMGCVKVAECFGCDGSNQKPSKKKNSSVCKTQQCDRQQ